MGLIRPSTATRSWARRDNRVGYVGPPRARVVRERSAAHRYRRRMTARDARHAPAPAPPPPAAPSFLRRHPVLAGFGVLAALSLFAAYWPASAIVTAVIVAGRATGADQAAYVAAQRGVRALARRIRYGRGAGPAPAAPGQPGVPGEPSAAPPSTPEPPLPHPPAPGSPTPTASSPGPPPVTQDAGPHRRAPRQRASVRRGPRPKTPTGIEL